MAWGDNQHLEVSSANKSWSIDAAPLCRSGFVSVDREQVSLIRIPRDGTLMAWGASGVASWVGESIAFKPVPVVLPGERPPGSR